MSSTSTRWRIVILELVLSAMLGAMMFTSRVVLAILPNIHLVGMLTMVCTIVFRVKGLLSVGVYVFLEGLFSGFNLWWIPYLYVWAVLWAMTIILPRKMPKKIAAPVYAIVCALHGLAFGTLCAPAQALTFGYNMEQTIAWIVSGIPFDIIHGVSNFFVGFFLIVPLSELLKKLLRKAGAVE